MIQENMFPQLTKVKIMLNTLTAVYYSLHKNLGAKMKMYKSNHTQKGSDLVIDKQKKTEKSKKIF